jgi:Right handed beta helix region
MCHGNTAGRRLASLTISAAVLLAAAGQFLGAATLCVNPSGTGGCYNKIAMAIANASPNDTIKVAPGTYKEGVVIGKPLSLIGAGRGNTTIDATGQPNGIYIDGIDNAGLSNVTVSGLRIENANFEGILVTNASSVTIADTRVTGNDKSLDLSTGTCPGLPAFETEEGFDCGEGIHLMGVAYSIVARSVVDNNSGGILISDDTGRTHDNLISGNVVRDNPFDCGITLASHPPAIMTSAPAPLGVFRNTISENHAFRNALGAGVGIFDSVPGAMNASNVVIHNDLTDNGLPGVTMHSHTPGQNLNLNMIIGNHIARNAADSGDAATPGPTGINVFGVSPVVGTVIAENVIEQEDIDVAVSTPAQVDVHLNQLLGVKLGVDNLGKGRVNATLNWWNCSAGPLAPGCSSVGGPNVLFNPWLTASPPASAEDDN